MFWKRKLASLNNLVPGTAPKKKSSDRESQMEEIALIRLWDVINTLVAREF